MPSCICCPGENTLKIVVPQKRTDIFPGTLFPESKKPEAGYTNNKKEPYPEPGTFYLTPISRP
ncbi:MAG: hypothetical protein SCALA701_23140 [Candidatus Scalindua sp.]|nr:MAG: hypothetical protein SCALA701_23140 [Candidatus Scalindua sp.]